MTQNNQEEINKLSLTYEEKQILIQKTVFLGATSDMVMLALGAPKERFRAPKTAEFSEGIVFTYHLPNDAQPTLLRFVGNKLTHAYKRSAIDF